MSIKQYVVTYFNEKTGTTLKSTVSGESIEQIKELYQPKNLSMREIKDKIKAGRPAAVLPESIERIKERMQTEKAEKIAAEYGISRATLYKYIKAGGNVNE